MSLKNKALLMIQIAVLKPAFTTNWFVIYRKKGTKKERKHDRSSQAHLHHSKHFF